MAKNKEGYLAPEAEVIGIQVAGAVLVDSLRSPADNIETTAERDVLDW